MAGIHITDIEAAINWWRDRSPSPDNISACAEVRALAEVYALMVYHHEPECDERSMPPRARDAWLGWYDSTPDAPCIAICSTSQGDDWCKGCGRSFDEVQHWPVMSPGEKRATWRRITLDGTAWRFNRYAERARENAAAATTALAAPAAALAAAPTAAAVVSAAAATAPQADTVVAPTLVVDAPAATPLVTEAVAEAAVDVVPEEASPAPGAAVVVDVAMAADTPARSENAAEAEAYVPEVVATQAAAAEPVMPALDTAPDTPVIVADELVDAAPAVAEAATALVVTAPASRPRKGLRAWWSRWVMRRRAG